MGQAYRRQLVTDRGTKGYPLICETGCPVASSPFVVSLLILLATGRSLTDAMTPGLVVAAVCGAIGAGVAKSTLRLARRAEERVELLEEKRPR